MKIKFVVSSYRKYKKKNKPTMRSKYLKYLWERATWKS